MTGAGAGPPRRSRRGLPAWLCLAALLVYAALIHHGVGPPSKAEEHWTARGFLLGWDWLRPVLSSPTTALALLPLPALLLAAAVFATGRSSIARALAVAGVLASALFVFYGVQFPFAWKFFHWRGSVSMMATALCAGLAATAPWLAESWRRLTWVRRLAIYLPLCLVVVALIRNATGTDPDLPFGISPWPVIPVFGLEVAGLVIAAWMAGLAVGVGGLAAARSRDGGSAAALALGAVAIAVATPALLVSGAAALGAFPFPVGARFLWRLGGSCVLAIALLATVGSVRRPGLLHRRARHLALGSLLAAIPLLVGLALERADYRASRDHRARQITGALQAFYDREQVYPERLDELVAAGLVDSIPRPKIGFAFLHDVRFQYQSFGTGYVLEFPAPRWVQCAYSPPWEDEAAEEEGGEAEALGGSWSCPSEPPELW
jgi:hypothetical protein